MTKKHGELNSHEGEKHSISVDSVEFGPEGLDYSAVLNEFGIDYIKNELAQLKLGKKELPPVFRRGIVFAHRDLGRIVDCMIHKKPFAVVTGVNPSGQLHFGNKLIIDQALFYQEHGADVFIPISDDETFVFGKIDSLEKALKNAYDYVIPDLIALGLKPGKTKIFISTKTSRAYRLAVKLSRRATFSMIKAIFGFNNETPPGQIFYGVMQSSHITFPQLEEFGGPKPVVVPVGIDQDPYIRLSRDIADKEGFIKPSSTYHQFMLGLRGGKMSGSKPESCIFLTDTPEVGAKKIMSAITGGQGSAEEQRKKGANPDVCAVYDYYRMHLAESDKHLERVREECKAGKRLCGDCKKEAAELMKKFLKEHHAKREKAKKEIKRFMIE